MSLHVTHSESALAPSIRRGFHVDSATYPPRNYRAVSWWRCSWRRNECLLRWHPSHVSLNGIPSLHQHNWSLRNIFLLQRFALTTCLFFFALVSRRNRLESNTDHWNALLLSLREMTEWVIRKDTELTSIERMHSPVRGDAASLAKQLVRRKKFFWIK